MMARRRVRWGSSVYVQKKSCSLTSSSCLGSSFAEPLARALAVDDRVAVEEAVMAALRWAMAQGVPRGFGLVDGRWPWWRAVP